MPDTRLLILIRVFLRDSPLVCKVYKLMNLQNIPSHALDIRHMFRATPEQTEVLKLESADNLVTVKLIYQDSVPTPDDLKKVKDLQIEDVVIMKNGTTEIQTKVQSIVKDKGKATIQLEVENDL